MIKYERHERNEEAARCLVSGAMGLLFLFFGIPEFIEKGNSYYIISGSIATIGMIWFSIISYRNVVSHNKEINRLKDRHERLKDRLGDPKKHKSWKSLEELKEELKKKD